MSIPSIADRTDLLLATEHLDAVVASSRPSVCHLSGVYFAHLVWPVPDERCFVVWGTGDRRVLLAPAWQEQLSRESSHLDVVVWAYPESPLDALVDLLRSLGLANAVLGVELEHMTVAVRQQLTAALPNIRLVGIDRALAQNRSQKTPTEIALMKRAARAGELGMVEAISAGREGMTERDFYASLVSAVIRNGADDMSWLALRWKTQEQHSVPRDTKISAGEIISIEMGCSVGGYLTDLQRTLVVPPAAPALVDAYRRLVMVHERTMQRLLPGRRASDVNREFLEDMKDSGLEMWTEYHLGHGVGLDIHENPFLTDWDDSEIQIGTVFAVEPVIVKPAFLSIEDVAAVGEDGAAVLSSSADWSELPRLGRPIEH